MNPGVRIRDAPKYDAREWRRHVKRKQTAASLKTPDTGHSIYIDSAVTLRSLSDDCQTEERSIAAGHGGKLLWNGINK